MKIKKIVSIIIALILLLSFSMQVIASVDTETNIDKEIDSDFILLSYKVIGNISEFNKTTQIDLKFEIPDELDTAYFSLNNSNYSFNNKSFEITDKNKTQKNLVDSSLTGTQTRCYFYEDGEIKNKFNNENNKDKNILSGSLFLDADKNISYGITDKISITLFAVYNNEVHKDIFVIPVNINEKIDEKEDVKETVSTLTPHLFITGYNISEETISAGEDFKLTINFKNTSKTEDIENVIMTYSLPAGMALAKASTNFYFPKVAKDSTASQTVTITSDGSLMDGLQNIGIAFSYEYKNESEVYTQGSDSETLSVKVGATAGEEQDDRFEISSIDLPDMVYLGQEEYITINLINKGSKALNNVSAKINSENISNNGYNEYLGQVAANSKGEIELVINPSTAGDIIGTITVSYEHEDGTVVETTRDFTVFCEDPNAWMDDPGMYDPGAFDEPIEEKKFPVWGYVLIGVGAVAVVVAAVVITKKVIKNKKEKALEEELDEDI